MDEAATCSASPRPMVAPPQIIVEELSGDDQYEDVSTTPSTCDRLLSVDGAWLDTSRRLRPSYRHRPAVRYKIRPGFSPTYRDSSPQLSVRYHR
ncbi:hypothetical protein IscW_ISCW006239 [Ixodes scapularis]|uniref:Uncharacterized protein n=1 Tax=Ixodes scapularis TaxID=6945 RepID=B7PML8_IXOSC|nr:hypothetical protein IscW_ISCW006239 [Ixodes scapularis]|eukprot:XP_002435016.1 hypothetical protein IscW_ISCW006239 [Ixodes scapularis]